MLVCCRQAHQENENTSLQAVVLSRLEHYTKTNGTLTFGHCTAHKQTSTAHSYVTYIDIASSLRNARALSRLSENEHNDDDAAMSGRGRENRKHENFPRARVTYEVYTVVVRS